MILDRIARSLVWACVGILGLIVSQTALAGQAHRMSPLLVVGPRAELAAAGPQYGIFNCQVGLDPYGRTCYDPYQIRHAYGIDTLINAGSDGTGHTIVIVDAFQSPTLQSDLAEFETFYGLPTASFTQIAPNGLTPFDPTNGDQVSWSAEISLDVESAHAMAPGAKIILVLAKSDSDADILNALKYAVDNNLGDVVSMSFGENESCVDPTTFPGYLEAFAFGTLRGITFIASSADDGALLPTCDGNSWVKSVSHPASNPLVTGVGGTELHAAGYCLTVLNCDPTVNPLPGTYEGEITWNEGPTFGDFQNLLGSTAATGGGVSVLFPAPLYQEITERGGKWRTVPDVAYSGAIFHGTLIVWTNGGSQGFYLFGGTSCGSPQWAALTAIADQIAYRRLGFLNLAIYTARAGSFHDITAGTNSALEYDVDNNPVTVIGFSAGPGYDLTTGNGSPVAPGIVPWLAHHVSPFDGLAAIATANPKGSLFSRPWGFVGPH